MQDKQSKDPSGSLPLPPQLLFVSAAETSYASAHVTSPSYGRSAAHTRPCMEVASTERGGRKEEVLKDKLGNEIPE